MQVIVNQVVIALAIAGAVGGAGLVIQIPEMKGDIATLKEVQARVESKLDGLAIEVARLNPRKEP